MIPVRSFGHSPKENIRKQLVLSVFDRFWLVFFVNVDQARGKDFGPSGTSRRVSFGLQGK